MSHTGQAVTARFEAALTSFVDKIKGDPNVLAVVLWGSLANDTVWEKSDMDVSVLVREVKLSTTSFCVEEDGLILNVGVQKEFDFKRMLERSLGGGILHSMYEKAKIIYAAEDGLHEFLAANQRMGADDRALAFFHGATFLIGSMEKIEKWLTVKNDPLYAQLWLLKAAEQYANMRLILDNKPQSREAILKVMAYAPEAIRHFYETPMQGYMSAEQVWAALAALRTFLEDNLDTLKQPVVSYMSDGEVRTVTTLVKHYRSDSHAIYHVFDFLAEMGVVARVTEMVRITPKSQKAIEEVAFLYIEDMPFAMPDMPAMPQGREPQW